MTESNLKKPGLFRKLFTLLGIISLILGVLSTGWLVLMTKQWLVPWSSLSIMEPPGVLPPPVTKH